MVWGGFTGRGQMQGGWGEGRIVMHAEKSAKNQCKFKENGCIGNATKYLHKKWHQVFSKSLQGKTSNQPRSLVIEQLITMR